MPRSYRAAGIAFLALLFAAPPAMAQLTHPPAEHRLSYTNLFAARVNPLGLQNQFSLVYRYRLMRSYNPFVMDNHIGVGMTTTLTPAFATVGAELVIQPLSVLQVMARYEYVGYFGTFDQLVSFPGAGSDFSESADGESSDASPAFSTDGSQLTLALLLQAAFAGVAMRNKTVAYRYDMDVRTGDSAFYSQYIDMLVPSEGWALTNDLDLLYVTDFGLIAGARYSMAAAFHDPEASPGSDVTHRVGPAIAWKFFSDPGAAWDNPTIVLLVQWYLEHPYRTGELESQGFPYLALAFSFNGDLWSSAGR